MVFCGLGEMAVNNFLDALNITSVTSVTFKRQERGVGSIYEAVANETCNEALAEEKERFSRIVFTLYTDLFQHMLFFQ